MAPACPASAVKKQAEKHGILLGILKNFSLLLFATNSKKLHALPPLSLENIGQGQAGTSTACLTHTCLPGHVWRGTVACTCGFWDLLCFCLETGVTELLFYPNTLLYYYPSTCGCT